ncbi:MAG TPA: hypothetical protein VFP54_10915 [Acidimicrobiales bacterium]|nr:hypothetical protein [Acidimicrobiales bacterium]
MNCKKTVATYIVMRSGHVRRIAKAAPDHIYRDATGPGGAERSVIPCGRCFMEHRLSMDNLEALVRWAVTKKPESGKPWFLVPEDDAAAVRFLTATGAAGHLTLTERRVPSAVRH